MSLRAAREYLGLNRNVSVLAASIFGLGMGEEMWQSFLPVYLTALGASGRAVGVFASCKDLLDSIYQYPGGWVSDHLGRKKALTLFTLSAMAGYAAYALCGRWWMAFAGLALAMAWKSAAFPVTFAVIGDTLPKGKRAIAFSVQSILVRVPRVIGAPIGGALIAAFGVLAGVRTALLATLVLGAVVLITQQRGFKEKREDSQSAAAVSPRQMFRAMDSALKWLLLSDCLVRIGEGLAAAFVVLYVIRVQGYSAKSYGLFYAIQQTVSILLYLPMGKVADITGRRPMVALTFLFFALFPLAVRLSTDFIPMIGAFILGGLKEMGEPARKSLIVDLSDPGQTGRSVGVYYGIRNLLVVPAGAVGGLLWQRSPVLPFQAAFAVGILGVLVFLLTSKGRIAHEMGYA